MIPRYNNPVVIVGHGTRDPEGVLEFETFFQGLVASPSGVVECGFLEFQKPSIQEAIDRAVARMQEGTTKVVVLPVQLLGARHVEVDIPREVEKASSRYPHIPIRLGRPLGADDKIIAICQARCEEALLQCPAICRDKITLFVVGRGMSDPDNTVVPQVARALRDRLRFHRAIGCYVSVASPLLAEAFQRVLAQSLTTILILPFFLFMGKMVRAVCEEAGRFSKIHPDCCVKVARHIGPDPLLRDALRERYDEVIRRL